MKKNKSGVGRIWRFIALPVLISYLRICRSNHLCR